MYNFDNFNSLAKKKMFRKNFLTYVEDGKEYYTNLENYPIELTTIRSARSIDRIRFPCAHHIFYAAAITVSRYTVSDFGKSASSVTRTIKGVCALTVADGTKIGIV